MRWLTQLSIDLAVLLAVAVVVWLTFAGATWGTM